MTKLTRISLSILLFGVLSAVIALIVSGGSLYTDLLRVIGPGEFETRVASGQNWIGPAPGSRIEIESLFNADGIPLNRLTKSKIVLLTVVEPTCGACTISRDQYKTLAAEMKSSGIDYFIVSFSPKHNAMEVRDYTRKLGIDVESVAWTRSLEDLSASINMIAYPSHMLLDLDGNVIKTFPGTSIERSLRARMTGEIVAEVKRHIQG